MFRFQAYAALLAVIVASAAISCRHSGSSSDVKLETDDSEGPLSKQLEDISGKVDDYINDIIKRARATVNPQNQAWTDAGKAALMLEVQRLSSGPRRGSGVGVHVGGMNLEVSVYTEIEAHFIAALKPELHEIKFTLFKNSIYRNNPVGLSSWRIPSLISTTTADHSIAPAVRIGEVIVGIDKFGHFFEQGYWNFDATRTGLLLDRDERFAFGQYMEGDPDLAKELHPRYRDLYTRYCAGCTRLGGGFGYYGAASTGIISFADIEVNESGASFYERLWADPDGYHFSFKDFVTWRWNEQVNKSKFVSGFKVAPPAP